MDELEKVIGTPRHTALLSGVNGRFYRMIKSYSFSNCVCTISSVAYCIDKGNIVSAGFGSSIGIICTGLFSTLSMAIHPRNTSKESMLSGLTDSLKIRNRRYSPSEWNQQKRQQLVAQGQHG